MIIDASQMLRRMSDRIEEYRSAHAEIHELCFRLKRLLDDAQAASETKSALPLTKDHRIVESTQQVDTLESKLTDTQAMTRWKTNHGETMHHSRHSSRRSCCVPAFF